METKINIRQAFRVFETIHQYGERNLQGASLQGLIASSDVDGYNITITDGIVRLEIHFHNTFNITSPNRRALGEFVKRLRAMDKTFNA